MGKGANAQLLNNAGTANTRGGQTFNQASSLYGFLDPALASDVTNPQGYGTDLPAINTASQQSLGGSTAGITGEGNLEAARTRNVGGFQAGAGTAARTNAKQLSQNALQVQERNAMLKQAQRDSALSALQRLYGIDQATAAQYLGLSNSALNAENQGSQNSFGATFLRSLGSDLAKTLTTPATYNPSTYGGSGGGG